MIRTFGHIAQNPMPGDVVEIWETAVEPQELLDHETLLRVLVVVEDYVGFKEYGKGRFWCSLRAWRKRLSEAQTGKVIRPGDQECPF